MPTTYLYRSVLTFKPAADNPTAGADVMMLDLEDAVHRSAKDQAREVIATIDLSPLVERGRRFGVRINSLASIEGIRDLATIVGRLEAKQLPIDCIQIPKVASHHEVLLCRSILSKLSVQPKIFPIVETPEGIEDIERIAAASDLVLFGQADITSTMYQPNEAYLSYARGRFCVACAQSGIPPIDTKGFQEVQDMDLFRQSCVAAKNEGFMGKAIIHPRQVPVAKEVFTVSQEELAGYKSTIESYESNKRGFVLVDGKVVAPPFVHKARLMLGIYRDVTDSQ